MQSKLITKTQKLRNFLALAAFLLVSTYAFAQNTVTGIVKDKAGDPLIGVSVVEKGTTNGNITDMDGKFTMNVAQGKTLVFSYIGYVTQEIKVTSNSLNVMMKEDDQMLEEVVVIGYGSMQRKDVTSSITTVKAEDLNVGVYTDPAQLLQGKVPGLAITTTGDPNGTPSITLRGASSLREGAAMQPYYVIDGIPGVDISMVAPDDIESIDVLRDATATAIYGSKAANGVIIINTKKGKQGRTNVSYSGYVAFDKILKKMDMATADDLRYYAEQNGKTLANDMGANTDWQDEVLRTGVSHNHNLSITGGSEKTTYMASINYQDRQGVIRGTDMDRLNVRSLITTKVLKDRLELSAGVNSRYGKGVGVPMGNEGVSVLDAMNYFSPLLPVCDENGNWTTASGSQNMNPMSLIYEDTSETVFKNTQFIGKATLEILKGLKWSANYSFTNNQRTYSEYHTHNTQQPGINAQNGQAKRNTYFGHEHIFETYGNYDTVINDAHKLSIMAGYSWEEKMSNDGFGLTVHDFYDDALKWYQLTYASTIDGIPAIESGTKETVRNISFYGRVGYSYNSKYMIQATIRRDGSSVFGKDNRWGTFPSISAAWNITEEEFMKSQDVLSNLKLRMGYGVSGNALGFGAYTPYQTYGASGFFTYNGKSWRTLAATQNANPDLKWESTGMFNIGIDYAFFNGRLNGTIEWYHKKTKDLIWDYPVSTIFYPYDKIRANVGEITNKGIEISINAVPVRTRDFEWSTTVTLSHNKNTVDRLSNDQFEVGRFTQGDPMVAGVSSEGYTQRIIEGEPLGTFYTFEFAGYNDDGIAVYYERDPETGERTGEVTDDPGYEDRTITGCAQPKLNFGWNNTFTWKNWNATIFLTGVFGNDIYNGSRANYTSPENFSNGKNVLKEFIYERPATDTGNNRASTRFIENGSYLRLANFTLGYTFKNFDNWLQNVQLYINCNNLFTITKYKGLDPEVNMGGLAPGVDYRWSAYPHTRTTMIGLKVNF